MKFLIFLLLFISNAFAGGAFVYEVGVPDNGWAAAGRPAYALDSSTVYGNPAGLSYLEKTEIMAGLQPKFLSMEFDNTSTPTVNDSNLSASFPGFSFFYNTKLSEKVGFGVGLLSFMGQAIDYGDQWYGKDWIQNSALLTMDLVPAFSYKFSDKFSLGLGLDILPGKMKQQIGLGGPASTDQLTYEDSTIGLGINGGVLYNFSPQVRFGIKYRSPIKLNFKDTLSTSSGALTNPPTLDVGMTVPQEVSIGLFFNASKYVDLLLGFDWQNWQQFGEITVESNQNSNGVQTLNANLENTWNISLGSIWTLDEIQKFTFGLAYDSSAVENSKRTVMQPMAAQFRISLGYMVEFSENRMFDLNFTLISSGNDNPVNMGAGKAGQPAINGNYDPLNLYSIGINYKWKW